MSKNFWGHSTSNREPATAKSREQQEKDQVSTLYELGLLSNSDKKPRRKKDKDQVLAGGGARVAGSHPKKGTQIPAQFHVLHSLHPSAYIFAEAA